eukprot:10413161-Prorocentrum_lima.AAC.1
MCIRDRFARGVLPNPLAWKGEALHPAEAQWLHQGKGFAEDLPVFTDGAAFWPQLGFRRQAGWAVAQISWTGQAVQALWGPMPGQAGPLQTARDGEDWAIVQLARLGPKPKLIM